MLFLGLDLFSLYNKSPKTKSGSVVSCLEKQLKVLRRFFFIYSDTLHF